MTESSPLYFLITSESHEVVIEKFENHLLNCRGVQNLPREMISRGPREYYKIHKIDYAYVG